MGGLGPRDAARPRRESRGSEFRGEAQRGEGAGPRAERKRLGDEWRSGGGAGADASEDFVAAEATSETEVVVELEAEPGFGAHAEVGAEAEGGVGGDRAGSVDDGTDAVGRDVEVAGELIDADAEGFHELLQQDLAGVDGVEQFGLTHGRLLVLLVVVHDLHVERIARFPGEADAPLGVDPNAAGADPDTVGAGTVAFESFEVVAWRDTEVLRGDGSMEQQQFPPRDAFDGVEAADGAVVEEPGGPGALERTDHMTVYNASGVTVSGIGWEGKKESG